MQSDTHAAGQADAGVYLYDRGGIIMVLAYHNITTYTECLILLQPMGFNHY